MCNGTMKYLWPLLKSKDTLNQVRAPCIWACWENRSLVCLSPLELVAKRLFSFKFSNIFLQISKSWYIWLHKKTLLTSLYLLSSSEVGQVFPHSWIFNQKPSYRLEGSLNWKFLTSLNCACTLWKSRPPHFPTTSLPAEEQGSSKMCSAHPGLDQLLN